jgi:TetR/AcrR family transcriptional regulator, fatty acid metabolism regulator protein
MQSRAAAARNAQSDKRARILDAAVRIFAERGFFTATVAEVAKAAGVADGTIYLYFKGKEDLLARLFEEKMTGLVEQARAEVARGSGAADRLKRFIRLHFSLVEKNPALASVLIVEMRRSSQVLKLADRGKVSAYVELIAEIVREGQQKGELDAVVSPSTARRAVFGALDELANGWLLSGRKAGLKKTAAEVSEWLVRGLLPRNGGKQ